MVRRGQRGEVRLGLALGAPAQAEGEPLQRHADQTTRRRGDEQLAEAGHHRQRGGAQRRGVGGDLAPAEDPKTLLGRDLLDATAHLGDLVLVPGQEGRAHGVRMRLGELEVDDLPEERVRHAQQDARAVPGVGLGPGGAAVLEVAQRGERLGDDVVAGDAGQRGDEGDAARVVLVARVVEPLR